MIEKILWKNAILILLILSFFLHFWGLENPNEVVFDEVHFGKFASSYMNKSYHFDVHPPLGKMIIAAGGALTGFKPGFNFETIGLKYPNPAYYGLRFFPALAGALIPLLVYLILRNLGVSKKIGILGMLIVIFENSLLTVSRFILIDIFLIFFGLAGLLFYLISRKQKDGKGKILALLVSGLFLGAAFSIKWTGLVFWFLVLLMSSTNLIRHLIKKHPEKIKPIIIFSVSIILVPLIFYTSVFALHFHLLPYSGPGDPFMTPLFQSTLINNPNYNPDNTVGFFEKFAELNRVMLSANAGITVTHPYSISWYSMPIMYRSLYYWTKTENGLLVSRIYLLGNPFVWWSVLVSIILFCCMLGHYAIKRKWRKLNEKELPIFLLIAYLLNVFTFAFISRVLFIHYYFPSLVLGIILFCLTTQKLFERNQKLFWGFIILIIASFIFFSPLTYGIPLDNFSYNIRNWLPSWI